VTRFADDDFVQTRYNLRTADERYDTRDEDDYDYEQAGRRKASQPSPRVGQRRARSPSPVYARASTGRGSARRRETGLDTAMAKRGTAMARHRPVEDYVTHPLDDFDRYMLARRERVRLLPHTHTFAHQACEDGECRAECDQSACL
jgi:hypothetical protein